VQFRVPVERFSFTGREMTRIVEPGAIELMVGTSSTDLRGRLTVQITGPTRTVGSGRALVTEVAVRPG
jgi:beta-glucosidase